MSKFAWVTLATNDSYSLGALVLANSLKRAGTSHQLVVLITPGVSNAMRERLQSVFNVVEEVNVLDSQDSANLALLARPELGITFTKLHCWRLVQFEKCVFLDADTLVLQNSDELFEREELSAAPDVGWPDCFNSGVFVYRPNLDTYGNLIDFAVKQGSFDGGDQGLLNLFFSDWAHRDIAKHLPFIYNTCSTACYSYLPAFKKFGQNVKILHFIGTMKPWLQSFDSQSGQVNIPSGSEHVAQYLQLWWSIFFQHVHRDLTAEMTASLVPPTKFLLQSITISDDLFVNNSATTPCNNDTEPITFVDPWDGYQAPVDGPPTTTTTTTMTDEPSLHSHLQNVLQQIVGLFTTPTTTTATQEKASEVQKPAIMTTTNMWTDVAQPRPTLPQQIGQSSSEQHRDSPRNIEKRSVKNEPEVTPTVVQNCSDPDEAGIAGALSHVTLGAGKSPEQEAYEHQMRRQFWEAGNIDYMGKDSFDNIWARISKTIDNVPAAAAETSSTETTTAAAPAAAAPAAPKPAAEAPKKSATGK